MLISPGDGAHLPVGAGEGHDDPVRLAEPVGAQDHGLVTIKLCAPGRLMRITGPRGSGKTVLLTALGDIATRRGWSVVNVSGKEALCASIQEQLVGDTRLRDLNVQISLPFVSAGAKIGDSGKEPSFREAFARATRSLSQDGAGLLIRFYPYLNKIKVNPDFLASQPHKYFYIHT